MNALLDKPVPWLAGEGPDALMAVSSGGSLARNLSDFPFPERCSEEEKRAVEERVLAALESLNMLAKGQYYSLPGLEPRKARFLAERQFITGEVLSGNGTRRHSRQHYRGVYVSDDQFLSITVNDKDHLSIHVLGPDLQVQQVWRRINEMDDMLGSALDFAYDSKLGFLTRSLAQVGTGLRAMITMVLPGLAMSGKIVTLEQKMWEERSLLRGLKVAAVHPAEASTKAHRAEGPTAEALYLGVSEVGLTESQGDLFQLSNLATLGMAEEEIFFHVRRTAKEIFAAEKNACEELIAQDTYSVEDRVGRALGIARGAHLLSLEEAVWILASLRLGMATGVLEDYSIGLLNELLLSSQSAHLELKAGGDCDDLAVNLERASLFRARFS